MAAQTTIGVLALQGSFREHITCVKKLGVNAIEVRKPEQLDMCSGLIIPGGESTTMANVATRWGMVEPLRAFAASKRPIWGTCAGLIFLAEEAEGMKEGGQVLLGGLHCKVHRNFFGSQIDSFEAALPIHPDLGTEVSEECGDPNTFRAFFIRAPAITDVGPKVQVLGEYVLSEDEKAVSGLEKVIVAVREAQLMATAFHPELTADTRWHRMFVNMCLDGPGPKTTMAIPVEKPSSEYTKDLPVFHLNRVC
mmetsp:Transcript_38284/g.46166  ORF Transcript_38284/g.46166 Transcript_38284/m.46166 type:complete len:251 (-) Transcript_38284:584-1336(-)|eukprot:CAMPEP_0197851422 /NCGR_PEP_ID=MMETSP1438-20131217/18057_1 /TAXON_ID=1461541 /ORGANISM="Pterosperma sp., Strain CCMP1384" /LENGTH=250 /DNA_ID=CAMNT_0043465017 /DNA_START=144 /DNA_END=896 /DNA_ORIENTATION=-